ncbi:MAG TPA: hypothetical protein VHF89_19565 [Solirubrobacteraceae bacterium]|nr:hypothetical protein [Solirubrobacteraceae bacterium]
MTAQRVAALFLAAAALAAVLAIPAYSAYDSIWSLVWAQEIRRGELPSFDGYRAPTQHPLWVAVAVVLAEFGAPASRLLVGVTVAGWVALVLGSYRLAAAAMSPAAGWVAAALVASRLDYAFYAMRAYVDIPFLALVAWAAALEAERPRRGGAVWALIVLAGLLRPEAWLLGGLYVLWRAPTRGWPGRARDAAVAAIAPAVWSASDWIVTGDPLYSLHYTTRSAEALGRRLPLAELPERTAHFMVVLTKPPVLLLGLAGMMLAWRVLRPRARAGVPAFLVVFGLATFLAVSARGFAVVDRYLLVSAFGVTMFAAFALGGWTSLPRGRGRTAWIAAAAVVAVAGAGWTASRFDWKHVVWQVRSRERVHDDLVRLLGHPRVVAAQRCGPVTVPNHKLLADVRYLVEDPRTPVLPRSLLADAGRDRHGVALFVVGGRRFLFHPAYGPFDQLRDSPLVQVPGPRFERVAVGRYVSAYVSCP